MERAKSPDRESSNVNSKDGPSEKFTGAESCSPANSPQRKPPMFKRILAKFGPNYVVLKLMIK